MTHLREVSGPAGNATSVPPVFGAAGGEASMSSGSRVIIVDDDEMILNLVCSIAEIAECSSVPVSSLSRLDECLVDCRASDLIVLDLNLGDTDGVSVLRRLHERSCRSSIIVLSGCEDRVRRSAVDFGRQLGLTMLTPMAKPFDHATMISAIRQFANTQVPLTESDVQDALKKNEFDVHMQPIIDIRTRRVVGAEALVRWQHPIRGIMMPGDFISIAEETGLIVALGEQVLNAACAQASHWCHQGPASVVVSVNLSVQQLRQEGFASRVRQALERHNLPARLLELELTESMLAEHSEAIVDNINALQALGVSLSVDDFGTGYSSLAYLKRFPISTLKIDRAFIAALNDAPGDDAIVRAVIAMAHSLSLQVVAEGVETEAQLQFLKENGCDDVQGYLISRPIDAEAFTTLLEQSQPARDQLDTLGR